MKREKILVSICCITYNHEKFIKECIEGFLKQKTDFNFEILIHDDASNDGTPDIIKQYEIKYPKIIKPIYQKENKFSQGINPDFKFNYPRAKGKYMAICEGDDYWVDPYKLQKQVDFLEANPEYVVCSHNAKIVDEAGNLIQEKKLPKLTQDRDYSSFELQTGAFLLTLSMVFRNVIEEIPDFFYKILNGDTVLISLLGAYGKGKYIEDIEPAGYRIHYGGVWSKLDRNKRLKANRSYNAAMMRYYAKQPEILRYYKAKQATVSRKYIRDLKEVKGFKNYLDYNFLYIKYNPILKSKYRLKELLKNNWYYWRNRLT